MITNRQFEPVSIIRQTMEKQSFPAAVHDFYEFVYICAGGGMHKSNQASNPFTKGTLFFIGPNQQHSYEITEPTEVIVVRFTECAKVVLKEMVEQSNGRAVSLAKAKSPLNPKVVFNDQDEQLVLQLLETLQLLCEAPSGNENLCYYQLLCLINVIERNLAYRQEAVARPATEQKKISRILGHIHKYLQKPEMLTLSHIASRFNFSPNALGLYFKKELGMPVKQYINNCRLEAIKTIVANGELTLSEVAWRFGFTDESHFYKSFKKHFGISPSEYRTKQLQVINK